MKTLFVKNDFYDFSEYSNLKYAPLVHVLAAFAGVLTSFVNAHIWTPASTYYLVMALVFGDFLSGLLVGIRSPLGFETRKAKKILFTLVAYTACMVFAHKFSRNEPALFWMPQAVLMPIVVINFLSFVKNLSLLGVLPEKIAQTLYKNIDRYKNPEPLTISSNESSSISVEELLSATPESKTVPVEA